MKKQRSPGRRSRRNFLRVAGAAGFASVAGCMGGGGSGANGSGSDSASGGTRFSGNVNSGGNDSGRSTTVAILAAGSLQNALSNGLKPVVDVPVQIESHGSATVARMISESKRDPDIVSVADVALFDQPLSPPWYSVFTSNAVVIVYNPDTDGGQRLAEAGNKNWYKPMVSGDTTIGRTDPDQDPLGYRTLFTLELASRYYDDASNLKKKILDKKQIYPETSLISQFETGSIDAAFAYRNMAVERDYEYIDLPGQIDLSDPKQQKRYSTVSYSLPSGQTVQGGLISYGSTIRKMSDAALNVFAALTSGEYLKEHGFLLGKQFPMYEGNVPQRVPQAVDSSGGTQSMLGSPSGLSSAVTDLTVLI